MVVAPTSSTSTKGPSASKPVTQPTPTGEPANEPSIPSQTFDSEPEPSSTNQPLLSAAQGPCSTTEGATSARVPVPSHQPTAAVSAATVTPAAAIGSWECWRMSGLSPVGGCGTGAVSED